MNTACGHWQAQLQHAPKDLPCERPNGALENRFEHKLELKLDTEQTRKLLQQAPAAYRTQVNDLLLTALARTVCRWSGQGSTLIQLEGHGREDLFDDVDLTRSVGWFTSLFPVNLTPAADLGASIKSIKEQLRNVPDKGLGYGALRYLGTRASTRRTGRRCRNRVSPSTTWGSSTVSSMKARCSPRPPKATASPRTRRHRWATGWWSKARSMAASCP